MLPADRQDTAPVVLTVPTEGVELLHVPPMAGSVSAVVEPAQATAIPEIVPVTGSEFTVTIWVAAAAPQLLASV